MSVSIPADADEVALLREALAHGTHLLPSQNPLDRFVHHNPLHAFEHRPFEEAVEAAATLHGAAPYWPEARYRALHAAGRIDDHDLDHVLERHIADDERVGPVSRRELVRRRMHHAVDDATPTEHGWLRSETDALRTPREGLEPAVRARLVARGGGDGAKVLGHLWSVCEAHGPALEPVPVEHAVGPRVRDRMVAGGGPDPDRWVHPLLIRWLGAYLDHGIAYWPMQAREQGFFTAFLDHLAQPLDLGRPWLRGLRAIGARARSEGWTAEHAACVLLHRLGHPPATWGAVVEATLLALPGWMGMVQRLHDRPDTAPEALGIPFEVLDVLAVRLAMDASVAEHLLPAGPGTPLVRAEAVGPVERPEPADPAWFLFGLAQVLGLDGHAVEALGPEGLRALIGAARAVDGTTRRRLWHLAYERHFVAEQLDALAVHAPTARPAAAARVQVACCIDDREESLRRHLEEVAPWVETLGYPGHFGIAMYYQGHDHARPVALGPAGAPPRHLVREAVDGTERRAYVRGRVGDGVGVGSQTLVRGTLLTLGGLAAVVPMALRILAPAQHARWFPRARVHPGEPLDRCEVPVPPGEGLQEGFTLDERVAVVGSALRAMGLVRGRLAPLVVCLGHGSHSANNPHEAAYNCGACGGGRGGPNARLFARWANDPEVRAALRAGATPIPDTTWFVGGCHDTASDTIEAFDLERVPASHDAEWQAVHEALGQACGLDALERGRRFADLPLEVSVDAARRHVVRRAEDLAQLRPEYNHNGNGLCLVGRRAWSRGLFLDQRAFLCSYDPGTDVEGAELGRWLAAALPVGAGINLEYWFGAVDPVRYGSGTKAAHNITGLLGVMDGHQSDLRTGLYAQMVELHEPVRLLCVIEAPPEAVLQAAAADPVVQRHVANRWVHLACIAPDTGTVHLYADGAFVPWRPRIDRLPRVPRSADGFVGSRATLPPMQVGDVA